MIDEGTEHAEMNTSAYIREEEVNEEDSHLLSWDEWLRRHVAQLLLVWPASSPALRKMRRTSFRMP